MKNILIFFLYKEGAGPVFTLEMARGLAQNGCNIYAILSNKISNKESWEKETLFKSVHFIETGTKKTAIQATLFFFLRERFILKKQYRHIHFDYIISTFYHPWAITLSKCFRGKRIVICHDPIHHSGVKLIERILTTQYIKSANDIIVLTKSFIKIVEKRFNFSPQHIHYMPHGRMAEYKTVNLTSSNSINENSNITFLFFGRIEKYKGLHILAKAYKKLLTTYKNISLTIAGSGNFDEYQTEFANLSNTTIVNKYIPDEEIYRFFSKPNTILVLPYLDASQSGVIPIALEYGTPIIASDTGGLKEQLDNGNIGYFCIANDSNSLKEKMELFINNPQIILQEKTKASNYLQKLNWNIVTRNILTI